MMGREGKPEDATGESSFKPGIFEKFYLPLYKAVIEYLPSKDKCGIVVDLGCGVGFFAKVLFENGYTKYIGVDFSPAVVEKAKVYAPGADFIVADLRSELASKVYQEYRVFVALESLEHIKEDIEVLEKIPSRSLVVFSVPNYDSRFHVRYFASEEEVIDRYKNVLDFIEHKNLPLIAGGGSRFFIFKAIRK